MLASGPSTARITSAIVISSAAGEPVATAGPALAHQPRVLEAQSRMCSRTAAGSPALLRAARRLTGSLSGEAASSSAAVSTVVGLAEILISSQWRVGSMIDLQAHSTVSDGQLAPSDVAIAAADAGVTVMSLTDHDAVAGVPDAIEAANQAGIECVPAVEMSCVHRYSDDLHMLGYWVDLDAIAPACARAQEERVSRAREIIERLNGYGVEVTFEAAVAEAGAADSIGVPYRPCGRPTRSRPFFEEYLVPGAKAFVPRSSQAPTRPST